MRRKARAATRRTPAKSPRLRRRTGRIPGPGSLPMRPRPASAAPDAPLDDAAYAAAACAACGVALEARLHAGEIVDVFRGSLRGAPVAVKLVRERWRGHPGAIELVAREHRVLAAIDHPHVVRARCV